MAKIKVYQAKEENMEAVKNIIDVEEQNPTAENLQNLYTCVLDTEDMALPESYIEEDILIDSMEVMVNASQNKVRDLGAYDVIEVQNKGKKTQILLLADEEYEIIEG
ncbi:hypothetical protein CN491_01585 [Bacillus cereus]|uniref:Group-specific protein n=1 Tax=Bacillus cereus TaxID=1396 RepID=A0A2A7HZF8_BACCE|nr:MULTISPECIES: hypothetical protein [Bacillus cereus group]MDR4984330.1 hypothetical protein [Bacillus cereus]MEA1010642.1 hypothetical protein [Bacillus cereus]PEC22203.1 hypothetical protein COM96_10475 [Bacillus cereus]PES99567.1 hypothetical protein CN491_01585 [Bacillus cereus]PFP78804.1 hypothetical protein COJ95_11100 [Bacillus cereus]